MLLRTVQYCCRILAGTDALYCAVPGTTGNEPCGTIAVGQIRIAGRLIPRFFRSVYDAMGCWCMVLRDAQYWASVWCYELCGTELAKGITRCAVLNYGTVLRDVRY